MDSVKEWSQEFDILYDNIMSNKAPGLTEYEKSVFLTRAQEAVVLSHFSPHGNPAQEGLDDSIERQQDFASLIVHETMSVVQNATGSLDPRAKLFTYPVGLLFSLNEQLAVTAGGITKYLSVVPLSYEEYSRLMRKPYKYPAKDCAWRLLVNTGSSGDVEMKAEVIAKVPAGATLTYYIGYVKKPDPIILDGLNNSDYGTINGKPVGTPMSCKLPVHLHNEILVKAVSLAKSVWETNNGNS